MQQTSKKNKLVVLGLSLSALIIPVVLIEFKVLNLTHLKLIYPLDDTYIHMSIAKNIALHGNWGISPNEFQSASSSILYTLLLSGLFKIFSVNTVIPFIINLVAGIVLLFVIQRRLQKEDISYAAQFIILLLVIFFTPLPTLIISGMEHTLQCLFSFLFIFNFSDWIASLNNETSKKNLPASLFLYGAIICALRYEGLFIIAIACCVLLYYKKIIPAFLLGFIAVLPLIIFGIYSLQKGSYFLPNSVLLKASPVEMHGNGFINYISNILIDKLTIATTGITALATQRLLVILPLVYLLFRNQIKTSYKLIILFLSVCTVLQLAFAKTGWFYRYEAYLILCSTVIISVILIKYLKQFSFTRNKIAMPAFLLAAFFLFFPLILRSAAAYSKASQACMNIYEQQYQMGSFIQRFHNTDTIAVNDIGAVSFFSKSTIIDLWGLANMQVAKAKKDNYNTPAFLNTVATNNDVKFAIVYDSWFESSLLKNWNKVATWQIENNVINGDATVSFYSIKSNNDSLLKASLENYQPSLPANVKVKYY